MHTLPFDSCVQGRGRGKQHGLVIMYREDRMDFVASHLVHLDEEPLGAPVAGNGIDSANAEGRSDVDAEQRTRRGGSRQTKNVGLMVALADKRASREGAPANALGKGLIVATTHL